ncbi:hypothetical protein QE152_g37027 [Popillia japonica]|uniref:Uncharacterized protein n=1 Tax=Popillia japonica TaxID=7064 RepID=A0AAW1IBM8_POPJA
MKTAVIILLVSFAVVVQCILPIFIPIPKIYPVARVYTVPKVYPVPYYYPFWRFYPYRAHVSLNITTK